VVILATGNEFFSGEVDVPKIVGKEEVGSVVARGYGFWRGSRDGQGRGENPAIGSTPGTKVGAGLEYGWGR
jgi:hypothetical protein